MSETESCDDERRTLCSIRTPMAPSNRRWAVLTLAMVIMMIAFERTVFYYYSFYSLHPYHYRKANSENNCNPLQEHNITDPFLTKSFQYDVITSISFILPILGGLLGDGVFGRVKTTLLGSIFYFTGTLIMYFLIHDIGYACSVAWHRLSIVFVVLAVGLIRPNIICMGATIATNIGMNLEEYFLLYYLGIGCGQTIGYALQLMEIDLTPLIIALVCLWMTFVLISRKQFKTYENRRLFSILKHAICYYRCGKKESSWRIVIPSLLEESSGTHIQPLNDKEDAVWLMRIIPLFATFIVQVITILVSTFSFNTVFTFIINDEGYLTFKQHKLWLQVLYASVMAPVALIMTPIVRNFDYWKCPLRRNLVGMCATFFSLLVTIVMKTTVVPYKMSGTTWNPITIMFLFLPQELLMGIGESIVFAAGNEIAYRSSRKGLESFTIGLFTTVWGIGAFGALALIQIFKTSILNCLPEFPNNREEHILPIYITLIVMVFFNTWLYYIVMGIFRKFIEPRNFPISNVNSI